MRIKYISIRGDKIFNGIDLDFRDTNNIVSNTIILAGENGTGKSTLLNIISNFTGMMDVRYNVFSPNEEWIFALQLTDAEADTLKKVESLQHLLSQIDVVDLNSVVIRLKRVGENDFLSRSIAYEEADQREVDAGFFMYDPNVKGILKSLHSEVEVNYSTSMISYVTSMEIDQLAGDKYSIKSSNGNLAHETAQLFVDIDNLDKADYAEWSMRNPEKRNDEGIIDFRMSRFNNAFNMIFPNKRFKRIINKDGAKQILFEEYGREIPLENLSSGEKQIIYRASFLLRNLEILKGAVVIIDEPELSLHPKWQINILGFYKKLFTDVDGVQSSQIFVATHSPFVIHNENTVNDKIIVLNKGEDGISEEKSPEYYGWKSEEAVTQAFDVEIDSNERNTVVFVEGPTDEAYFRKAIEVFELDKSLIIESIGRNTKSGGKFSGDTALTHTKNYLLSHSSLYKNKHVLLYDSDNTKVEDTDYEGENLHVRKVPFNEKNNLFDKGSENLLNLPEDFPKDDFYDEDRHEKSNGGFYYSCDLNKVRLCNWVCNKLSNDDQKYYLLNFKVVLEAILSISEQKS